MITREIQESKLPTQMGYAPPREVLQAIPTSNSNKNWNRLIYKNKEILKAVQHSDPEENPIMFPAIGLQLYSEQSFHKRDKARSVRFNAI